ncbi:MAG: metallophosphoesterase [Thermoleophilia bacterium]|nr:metallophosphoesterase [Thermoleophilia bacterium]
MEISTLLTDNLTSFLLSRCVYVHNHRATIYLMKPDAKCRESLIAACLAGIGITVPLYLYLEAQWVRLRQLPLHVPGLPRPWSGVTVLHLSDVHAGAFALNMRLLAKAVRWAEEVKPDLVFLTGDILTGGPDDHQCIDLLTRLKPPLGIFAVTGNHEYGITTGFLEQPRNTQPLWKEAGITLLEDTCICLPPRSGASLTICGGDYLTHGCPLLDHPLLRAAKDAAEACSPSEAQSLLDPGNTSLFPILLIHRPPASDSPLARLFPLVFAGHTHGGQLRFPTRSGLRPVHMPRDAYLSGVYQWGKGKLVVSAGLGVSFLPFRLFSRPEATVWRLVCA